MDQIFGHNLRKLRLIAGWEGKQLAARSGLSASGISRIERGEQKAKVDQIDLLCNVLRTAPDLHTFSRSQIRDLLYGDKRIRIDIEDADPVLPDRRVQHLRLLPDLSETA